MPKYKRKSIAKRQEKMFFIKPIWLLLALYAFAAFVRYLLSVRNLGYSSIMPDESIYLNIAKNLMMNGRVAYTGYSLQYDNLLYPLLLAPIYALPLGTNYFQCVQLLNSLMITAAIFPAFYAARRVTGNDRGAWITVLFVLILPDCYLAQSALTESVGYPLCFTALYIVCVMMDGKKRVWPPFALAGVGFLLFFSKFSLALYVAGLFAALLFTAIFRRDKRAIISTVAGCAVFGLMILVEKFLAAKLLAEPGTTYVNYYATVTSWSGLVTVGNGIKGSIVSLYIYLLAACILPVVAPAAGLGRLDTDRRALTIGIYVAFLLTLGGACYLTFKDLSEGLAISGRVELRYSSFLIPIFVMLTLDGKLLGMKLNRISCALLAFTLLASVLFTPFAIAGTGIIDNMVLTLISQEQTDIARWFYLVIGALLAVYLGYTLYKKGLTKKLRSAFLMLLAVILVVQGLVFNAQFGITANDKMIVNDAREIAQILDNHDTLFITSFRSRDRTYIACDTLSRANLPRISVEQLDLALNKEGIFQEITVNGVPISSAVNRFILFGQESYPLFELSDAAAGLYTSNLRFCLVDFAALNGKPLMKSLLRADEDQSYKNYDLMLYGDASAAADSVHISLELQADLPEGEPQATLTFSCGDFTRTVDAPSELGLVEIDVPLAPNGEQPIIHISCTQRMTIVQYHTGL